ncbi:MAG: hypothetical protein EBS39_10285, partial [Gammaproteobacteria bacterium]|nr:hypothetical protein [Gammaproteobacteria bacterium]
MPDAIRARRATSHAMPRGPGGSAPQRRAAPLCAGPLCAALLCAVLLAACGSRGAGTPPPTGDASPAPAAQPAAATGPVVRDVEVKVAPGDTLERIFLAQGLTTAELAALRADPELRQRLDRLRPDDRLLLRVEDGKLARLERPLGISETLVAERKADGSFTARVRAEPLETRLRATGATIEGSLFGSAAEAGISDAMALRIAGIFRWDIDFVLDIRPGDSFRVVHEVLVRDGREVGEGELLAVEFVNQGEAYRAVRWAPAGGKPDYYTPEGKSLRKAFLRAPLEFTRVSSGFNLYRRHPILNRMRAHRGVDYAAPTGTPVRAAGAGRVAFVGIKGGYGKVVELTHPGGVRLADGTLAGSALTMDQALHNLVHIGLSVAQASARVSTHAARYLGLSDR